MKSETLSCGFARVEIKGGQNRSERCESWCVYIFTQWASKSISSFNSKKLVKSETPSCIFARVALKGVQIARTIAKVGVHVFISNEHPNP